MPVSFNQLGPFTEPFLYKQATPFPRHEGVIDKGYTHDVCFNMRPIIMDLTGYIDDSSDTFTLSAPYRRGTVEVYYDGDRVDSPVELDSYRIQLSFVPATGHTLVTIFVPYSNIGSNARRQNKIITIANSVTLPLADCVDAHFLVGISAGGNVTLPDMTEDEDGLVIQFTLTSSAQSSLLPGAGATIDGLSSYLLLRQWVSVEVIYIHKLKQWRTFS